MARVGVFEGVGGIHISIWLVLLIGAVITAFAGVVIGLPTLRLRGDYLAIVTLGFGEMVAQVARNGDELQLGFNLTNGPPGINPVDSPGFGSWAHETLGLPAELPGLSRLVGLRDLRPGRRRRRPHVLGGDRARPHHALLLHPPA